MSSCDSEKEPGIPSEKDKEGARTGTTLSKKEAFRTTRLPTKTLLPVFTNEDFFFMRETTVQLSVVKCRKPCGQVTVEIQGSVSFASFTFDVQLILTDPHLL